ncbi:hypothetical protein P879_06701 [Paragonimus westermani]|uniref:Uncharacterized protein n=1 Tax=Paragonimus westermani TaxID=34504 RepID=A0A8T0DTD9_9TREM|nr:hypothetical protein P879_06701 [Paragonimus westermani]
MELCSPSFCVEIEKLINLISTTSEQSRQAVLVATVPSARRPDGRRGIPLVDALCSRPDVCLFEVTFSNRNDILQKVYRTVMDRLLL